MFISKRKREPANYMLKVDSFSLLSEAKTTKIESDSFKAVGLRWRLDVYPNGYDEENKNKDKHISLYVVLCNPMASWGPVCVDITFFVHDHIQQNYATFQDVNAHGTVLNQSNRVWGFNKLMSLETFMDSKNGYLFNDSCVFGVEINIAPQQFTQVDRCLLMTKPPSNMNSFTWTINKFSAVRQNVMFSDVFKIGKVKWKLSLYPKGHHNSKYLSMYLNVQDAASFPKGWKVYAKFKFRVRSDGTKRDIEKETEGWFCKSNNACGGVSSLMLLSQLKDSESSSFLLNDKLTVDVEISVMGMLKDFM